MISQVVRRSALEVEHGRLGARWASDRVQYALDFGDPEAEAEAARLTAGLAEFGPLDKILVCGPGAALTVARAEPEVAVWKLGPDEVLVMGNPDAGIKELASTCLGGDLSVVDVGSAWTLICLGGRVAASIMTELSTIDFDPDRFPDGRIAQGHVVNVSAIVRRHDAICGVAYSMLFARDQAAYAWDAIARIGRPYDLRFVGSAALARATA